MTPFIVSTLGVFVFEKPQESLKISYFPRILGAPSRARRDPLTLTPETYDWPREKYRTGTRGFYLGFYPRTKSLGSTPTASRSHPSVSQTTLERSLPWGRWPTHSKGPCGVVPLHVPRRGVRCHLYTSRWEDEAGLRLVPVTFVWSGSPTLSWSR